MTDLTSVFSAIISLILAVVSAFLVPWLKKKMKKQDIDTLMTWVEIAVAAAQQMMHNLSGEERKQYVLDFLSEKGYTVNDKEIDAAIEAAVLKLHQDLEKNNGQTK